MILSIVIVVFVLLVAYWWGNAGAFDALLHFICVVAAALLAVALWEPLNAIAFLGGGFADYGWGLTLGGTFLIALTVLRLAADKLCPIRPAMPRWSDWAFGTPLGLLSGALTVGLLVIAIGHMSMKRELLGHEGWRRPTGAGEIAQADASSPAAMVTGFTAGFLGMVSDGAMAPTLGKASLARWRPDIAADGVSLLRDSVEGGQGRLSVGPDGVSVVGAYFDPKFGLRDTKRGQGAYAVLLSVKRPGYDKGSGFNLSASQARLIDGASGRSVFPCEFAEGLPTSGDSLVRFEFTGDTAYVSTPPSTQESFVCLVFPASRLSRKTGAPLFLQLKGLRFQLPEPTADAAEMASAVATAGRKVTLAIGEDTPGIPGNELRVDSGLQGAIMDTNEMPGTLREQGGKLLGGASEHVSKPQSTRSVVRNFFESKEERIVMLRCTRGSTVDLFDADKTRKDASAAGYGAVPTLMDDAGNSYAPVGYVWNNERAQEFEVYFNETPDSGFTLDWFRRASAGGDLNLIYKVPVGRTIRTVVFSDPARSLKDARVVGKANLKVEPPA